MKPATSWLIIFYMPKKKLGGEKSKKWKK